MDEDHGAGRGSLILGGTWANLSEDPNRYRIQGFIPGGEEIGPGKRSFNLGESETTELKRLIELIEDSLGKKAVIDRQPMQPGDVPVTYSDISKAREMLNYNPHTKIEEGIPKFVEWFTNSRNGEGQPIQVG